MLRKMLSMHKFFVLLKMLSIHDQSNFVFINVFKISSTSIMLLENIFL
jgi:hypothetical protein